MLLGVAVLALVACGAAGEAGRPSIVVLAAASLTDVFREIRDAFEAERERPALLSFAGSQTLATQLREGVRADVIAVADPEVMADLASLGLVDEAREFASSRIVWVLRRGPDGSSLGDPARLESSNWALVLAGPEVPAGAYARRALDALQLRQAAEAHLVSQELDVRGVLAKLRLAGADLGMVYATDVSPDDPDLEVVELPPRVRVVARYAAARVRGTTRPEAAAAFLDFLESNQARDILRRAGFGTP
jgi:molybdate transport system substrate-binding protein